MINSYLHLPLPHQIPVRIYCLIIRTAFPSHRHLLYTSNMVPIAKFLLVQQLRPVMYRSMGGWQVLLTDSCH